MVTISNYFILSAEAFGFLDPVRPNLELRVSLDCKPQIESSSLNNVVFPSIPSRL